jgi:hypothetical protein
MQAHHLDKIHNVPSNYASRQTFRFCGCSSGMRLETHLTGKWPHH